MFATNMFEVSILSCCFCCYCIGGFPVYGQQWQGLPSPNWNSFIAQERLSYSTYHNTQPQHNSPDAQLAWLIARLTPPKVAAAAGNNSSSSSDDSKQKVSVDATAPDVLSTLGVTFNSAEFIPAAEVGSFTNGILGYTYNATGPQGAGFYRDAPHPTPHLGARGGSGEEGTEDSVEVALSDAADVLQQLASLSKGLR